MNLVLWIVAGVLAATFGLAGITRSLRPRDTSDPSAQATPNPRPARRPAPEFNALSMHQQLSGRARGSTTYTVAGDAVRLMV